MKKKILVIDDDVDFTKSVQFILESQKYDVSTAHNSKDGMGRLLRYRPDLLILDIMMATTLEGYGMAHKIKKDPAFKDLPILILTGMKDAIGVNFREAIEDSNNLSGVVFYDKPFELDDLLNQVKRMLESSPEDNKTATLSMGEKQSDKNNIQKKLKNEIGN